MKKTLANLLFFSCCSVLFFVALCQMGVIPLRFTYILSGSMRPTYEPGDLAVVHMTRTTDVKPGEIVLFSAPIGPTIHRVVAVENGQITTQGDANNTSDLNKITQVEGKVLFAIPKLGYVIDWIQIPFRALASLLQGSVS